LKGWQFFKNSEGWYTGAALRQGSLRPGIGRLSHSQLRRSPKIVSQHVPEWYNSR